MAVVQRGGAYGGAKGGDDGEEGYEDDYETGDEGGFRWRLCGQGQRSGIDIRRRGRARR